MIVGRGRLGDGSASAVRRRRQSPTPRHLGDHQSSAASAIRWTSQPGGLFDEAARRVHAARRAAAARRRRVQFGLVLLGQGPPAPGKIRHDLAGLAQFRYYCLHDDGRIARGEHIEAADLNAAINHAYEYCRSHPTRAWRGAERLYFSPREQRSTDEPPHGCRWQTPDDREPQCLSGPVESDAWKRATNIIMAKPLW
jgi:hypothetical protein